MEQVSRLWTSVPVLLQRIPWQSHTEQPHAGTFPGEGQLIPHNFHGKYVPLWVQHFPELIATQIKLMFLCHDHEEEFSIHGKNDENVLYIKVSLLCHLALHHFWGKAHMAKNY